MFTGIVERTGTIVSSVLTVGGRRLCIDAGSLAKDCALGASVCISGVCLTVAAVHDTDLEFDVISETIHKTTLGGKRVGDRVNLERSLRVGDRLDGHFVQGHVDGTAKVARLKISPREHVLWLEAQDQLRRYVVPKGSVAIDGVSLTIAEVQGDEFSVALIPTTLERTTLGDLRTGNVVNIESDMIVRAVERLLGDCTPRSEVTIEKLQGAGFV